MLAFVSKYGIDARIGGLIKPTYPEFEADAPEELGRLTWLYRELTIRARLRWNPENWVDHDHP
jgi:hypothetical protein